MITYGGISTRNTFSENLILDFVSVIDPSYLNHVTGHVYGTKIGNQSRILSL